MQFNIMIENCKIKAILGYPPSQFPYLLFCCLQYFFLIPNFRPLYDEIISVCLDIGELDAAVAVVADLEATGIMVSDETLDRVISAKQMIGNSSNDATL